MDNYILTVKDLRTYFFTNRGILKAVDGVNICLKEGETMGLVGESGCGKSITCLSILRLVPSPAGRIVSGQILFDGEDLLSKSEREMRKIRGKQISMILQDPMRSLNPLFTIGDHIAEPIKLHKKVAGKELWESVLDILRKVRIPSPEIRIREYPHQMSGGMRQRIAGAMALSCGPRILIADEPTTALDVTIQVQFLKLLKEIQEETKVSMIMVTHDFGILAKVCNRASVMYAGKVIECADVKSLFDNPKHPYTAALIESLPKMNSKAKRLHSIEGQPPDLINLPRGCSFAPRCQEVMETCKHDSPPQSVVRENHTVSCWLNQ